MQQEKQKRKAKVPTKNRRKKRRKKKERQRDKKHKTEMAVNNTRCKLGYVRGLLEKYPTFFFMRTPDRL